MDVKEKLVELIHKAPYTIYGDRLFEMLTDSEAIRIADYLIANGVPVQRWISVRDRLPEEKVNCIVHYKHAYCDNDDYWAIGIYFYDGEKFQIGLAYKVTHWMPLPQPPKEAE